MRRDDYHRQAEDDARYRVRSRHDNFDEYPRERRRASAKPRRKADRAAETAKRKKVRKKRKDDFDKINPSQISKRTYASKRKGMPAIVAVICALFIIFICSYVIWSLYSMLTPSIAVEPLLMSNMDAQQSAHGMIVRHEEVVFAPRDGRVEWAIGETERVRSGTHIASIQDTDAIDRLERDILSAEEEAQRLNERRPLVESDAAIQRTNTNLRNAVNGSVHNFATQNLSELNALHERLIRLTDSRNQMILNDGLSALVNVDRQLGSLMDQWNMNSENMYAPRSGIMFSIIDGHEAEVTPDNMYFMSPIDIVEQVDHTAILPVRDVYEGDPVFKIVGNTWYIVTHMPNPMAVNLVERMYTTIFIHNDLTGVYEPMQMRVHHIERSHMGTTVIFRSGRNVIDFLNQRNISLRTTDYVSRGLKVSNTAIVEQRFIRIPLTYVHGHGAHYVHVRTDYGLRPVSINISNATYEYAYVAEDSVDLMMGNVLLPASLHDDPYVITEAAVRIEHGVFRSNLGYASFTHISLDGDLSEIDGYTLLDPIRNPHLREFDIIVVDASTVSHGDILR